MPLPAADVEKLVRKLAETLDGLHHAGLGAYDLAPGVVFTTSDFSAVVMIPIFWLASSARQLSGRVREMPFVAPELGTNKESSNPAVADLYALGALAWHLLTGTTRKEHAALLPSEHAPELARWDAFVDGCCRTWPDRRFRSTKAALEALSRTSAAQAPMPAPISGKPKPIAPIPSIKTARRGKRAVIGAILLLAAAGALIYFVMLPRPIRGFADTILRYDDRSYRWAKWEKILDLDETNASRALVKLSGVVGWDAQSFWIVANGNPAAAIQRYREGSWSTLTKVDGCNQIWGERSLDANTLIFTGNDGVYKLGPAGLVKYGLRIHGARQELFVVAPDLFYQFDSGGRMIIKFANDKRTEDIEDDKKDKRAWVHSEKNVPLVGEYPVHEVRWTRTYETSRALGVAKSWRSDEKRLVDYKGDVWSSVMDIGKQNINDMWVGLDDGRGRTVVCVGNNGSVMWLLAGNKKSTQDVPVGDEQTDGNLMMVWGVSLEKYWTMDYSGTIWERSSGDWRLVVKGLYADKVKFKSSWVSPEGVVIAITEKAVWRLE